MSSLIYKEQTDEQLMKLYQQGNEEAFRQLYERHSKKIYGYLKRKIGNNEKTAEVYQEAFIKIHKTKFLYKENFLVLPWFFTIAKSVLIDELRKEKKNQVLEEEVYDLIKAESEISINPPTDVDEMINQLPEVQKQALKLRYVNENTFEEIAETLNLKSDNVRKIISRGINRLRQLVSEGDHREK